MKKNVLLVLSLVAIAVLSVGGTLAFFTDAEESTEVYTVGNIDIELLQNEGENGVIELMPGVKHDTKTRIKNVGDNDAYVWLTFAIPAALDVPEDASKNIIHYNTMGAFWDVYREVTKYHTSAEAAYPGEYQYPVALENTWSVNFDESELQTIDGIEYRVYTYKYNGILKSGETTTPGISTLYLDAEVDYNEETGKWVEVLNGVETVIDHDFSKNTNVIIKAHAIQTDNFDSFDAAFAKYQNQWNK